MGQTVSRRRPHSLAIPEPFPSSTPSQQSQETDADTNPATTRTRTRRSTLSLPHRLLSSLSKPSLRTRSSTSRLSTSPSAPASSATS
ncbi:hypothetical protein HYDPIDRAFT_114379, partial [Hydnomerulius pinastri MD-312]